MTDAVLTHDAGVSAFEDAGGVVQTTDDDGVEFSWDEENIVRVDAPADLTEAFDTERFYKISEATIARPIKQPYMVGDDIEWYQKPADELDRAAWSFDNAPFTLGHPDTGMVKNIDDIRGFWRNPRYLTDEDRLVEDLYVPVGDDEAMRFIEEHGDVSVGFYNRVHSDYDGNTGNLIDDEADLDGYQVDMFGNHVAAVERGRCSSEHGCGLDADTDHGEVVAVDGSQAHENMDDSYDVSPSVDGSFVTDYEEDGDYYAIAPDETSGDDPKYPINSCSDVQDAWKLRGHGDYDVSQNTLESRIKSRARDLGCAVPGEESTDSTDCGCDTNEDTTHMGDEDNEDSTDGFSVPDLSVDAIVEQNDAVRELKEERDALREDLDEVETDIEEALDAAENFSVEYEEDECICEAVEQVVSDLDEKVSEVEDLTEELEEYREEDIEDRLDTLEEYGADREEWRETADEADDPLTVLDEEIDRREEVIESAADVSVKDVEGSTDSDDSTDEDGEDANTLGAARSFGRGHAA